MYAWGVLVIWLQVLVKNYYVSDFPRILNREPGLVFWLQGLQADVFHFQNLPWFMHWGPGLVISVFMVYNQPYFFSEFSPVCALGVRTWYFWLQVL